MDRSEKTRLELALFDVTDQRFNRLSYISTFLEHRIFNLIHPTSIQ